MNNVYLNFDENKNLTHITFYFVNNEKSTVSVSELSPEIIELYVKESKIHNNSARKDRIYMSHQSFDNLDEYIELNSSHLDDQLIKFETHKLFEIALEKLPNEQKKLLHEIYFKKISSVELAEKYNVSKSAISHRHGRAKIALKKIIKQLDPSYNYFPVS